MYKIIMLSWKPGLNKIILNHELRDKAKLSLSEAKQNVDDLLSGKSPAIYLESEVQANKLLESLENLGVVCRSET